MSVSILALTRYDRMGASSRVRFLQYVPHLRKMGFNVTARPLLPDAYLHHLYRNGARPVATVARSIMRRLADLLRTNADIIWLQRELLPYMPFGMENALLAGRQLVIDFDDAHHLYYRDHRSSLARALLGAKTDKLMRRAAAVTLGNRTLMDYAAGSGASTVHFIPSAVDTTRLKDIPMAGEFTVGWIGTPLTAEESLPLIREPLMRFLKETGARCVFMGVREDQFPEIKATRLTWSEAGEALFLASISVGLCPLSDTPWTRGKSGYKIIQYMAAGCATLTSPVGIAADLVRPDETGFHCPTPEAWYERLMELYRSPERVAALGRRARDIAVSEYDTAVTAGRLYKIFTSCPT